MTTAVEDQAMTRFREVLREIARGGLTGMIVGIVGGGIGGRIVMRAAAILVPESLSALTENGNRIGDITVGGTLTLGLFGLTVGVIAAPIWVVVSPWIPGSGLARALLAMPIAVALGVVGLVNGDNVDFFILRHNAVVVALLVGLVAVMGFLFALLDDALERRLPLSTGRSGGAYGVLVALGTPIAILTALAFISAQDPVVVLAGLALIGVGLATLGRWLLHVQARPEPAWLPIAGRGALAVAVVVGLVRAVPELSRALGA